jgi:hypothetical protein
MVYCAMSRELFANFPIDPAFIGSEMTSLLEEPSSLRIGEFGMPLRFTEAARFDPAHPAARHRGIWVESLRNRAIDGGWSRPDLGLGNHPWRSAP